MADKLQDFDKTYDVPILGIDEAGRGPLCGPVISACVFWKKFPNNHLGIDDSKKLTSLKREKIFEHLSALYKEDFLNWGIGIASAFEIDEMNILNATKLSMFRAFKRCQKPISEYKTLVDGNQKIPQIKCEPIIKGDQKSFSIATASIIAKVTRDKIMEDIHRLYPEYGFNKHKGYGTNIHREKIKELGFCPYHRRTFRF